MNIQTTTNPSNTELASIIEEKVKNTPAGSKKSLTRSDLSNIMETIAEDMTAKEANFATHSLLEIMANSLIDGNRIEVRGFGTWEIRFLSPRTAHNPRTGEKVATIGKFRPHFKAGKALKHRVNDFYQKHFLNKTVGKASMSMVENVTNREPVEA